MGTVVIDIRPQRHDPGGIDAAVRVVVVRFDVGKVDRPGDARPLIQIADIARQVCKILQTLAVALEVPVVHRVKTDQRGEQAPVGLGGRTSG